jgi:beta-glucanase (GH16 family)
VSQGGKTSDVQSGGSAIAVGGTQARGGAVGKGGATTGGTAGASGSNTDAAGGAARGGSASGGGSGSGGSTTGGAAAGPCAASPGSTGRFELLFEDQFNSINGSRWRLMTHSWDGNLAQFSAANAATNGGILTLSLTSAPGDAAKPFRGVEMRSVDTLTYGRVEGSIRFASGSGVISALVTIYTPWPPDDWNELDVEFLGKSANQIQFNHMINIPPADPNTGHLQFPKVVTLPFNATAGFHTYAIEWIPGRARFLVDGAILHETTQEMSRMVLPQNLLLTIWASNSVDWAGAINATTPTTMQIDWVRMCRYVN